MTGATKMKPFSMLNPRFFKHYRNFAFILGVFFSVKWYSNTVDNNVMNTWKNKSKLFGGRIIYPEEEW